MKEKEKLFFIIFVSKNKLDTSLLGKNHVKTIDIDLEIVFTVWARVTGSAYIYQYLFLLLLYLYFYNFAIFFIISLLYFFVFEFDVGEA